MANAGDPEKLFPFPRPIPAELVPGIQFPAAVSGLRRVLLRISTSLGFRGRLRLVPGQRFTCVVCPMVARVAAEEFLKCSPRFPRIIEVVLVELPNGKQGVRAVLASGILTAQKSVLPDRLAQDVVIVQAFSHLNHQLGHGHHTGISFRRGGRAVVDPPVGIDRLLVVVPGAVRRRTPMQSLPHALGGRKLRARPSLRPVAAGQSRQRG